jgi:MYXO-CTERM domain-containing protein
MNPTSVRPLLRRRAAISVGLLGLALGAALVSGRPAQAQATLSLTPLATTVAVGSTVTFTLNLTGGTSLSGYNVNIVVDPTLLQFVNTGTVAAPVYYTSTNGSFFYLGSKVNTTAGVPAGVPVGGDLNFTGGDFAAVNNVGTNALGTFQVKVLSALPLTGSAVSFGPISASNGFNGTNVQDGSGNNELTAVTGATILTPAPEPSQTAALGMGVLGLAALALRSRRIKNKARP